MQADQTRLLRTAHLALLSATDTFCMRIAEPSPRESRTELFVRLLREALESDRLIRKAMQMNASDKRVEKFSKRIRADFQDALRLIGPLDCVQQMAQHPKPGTN
jgi:hypothetical protein